MQVNHNELMWLLKLHIDRNEALMIRGDIGIGKTMSVTELARQEAKRLGKELVIWDRLTTERKHEFYYQRKLREQSYILSLIDLLSKLPEDMSGLPRSREHFMEWVPDLQFWVLAQPETHGLAFFDEVLQAQQAVQKTIANVFLENMLGTLKLSDNISVVAASNRKEDKCGVIDMLEHLKNRMSHVELAPPTTDAWLEWGSDAGIDTRILAFHQWKQDQLYIPLKDRKNDAYPTPRSWHHASNLIQDLPSDQLSRLELAVSTRVGDAAAGIFTEFVKLRESIDCEGCLNNPERISSLRLDEKWALLTWMSEKSTSKGYGDKICKALRSYERRELETLLLHLMKGKMGTQRFSKLLLKPEYSWMFEEYHQLLKGLEAA